MIDIIFVYYTRLYVVSECEGYHGGVLVYRPGGGRVRWVVGINIRHSPKLSRHDIIRCVKACAIGYMTHDGQMPHRSDKCIEGTRRTTHDTVQAMADYLGV